MALMLFSGRTEPDQISYWLTRPKETSRHALINAGLAKLIGLNDLNTTALVALILLRSFGGLGML